MEQTSGKGAQRAALQPGKERHRFTAAGSVLRRLQLDHAVS
jgi:hypothetical protein